MNVHLRDWNRRSMLSKASARVRLADTIEEEDAERVIELVKTSLSRIGAAPPEPEEFDEDVVDTESSKSQRDRIKSVRSFISDRQGNYEFGVPLDEILDGAEEIGMTPEQIEHELDKLKRQGDAYEPKSDYYRLV